MEKMKYECEPYELELTDESTYTVGSVDNARQYEKAHSFSDGSYSSKYGLVIKNNAHKCILLASGGATSIHEHSLVVDNERCFVAIGDHVASLNLPHLDLIWAKQLDGATCFGVYFLDNTGSLIVHGELEITRISLDGNKLWSTSGKDIFTGGIQIFSDHIEAVDFNEEKYRIDLEKGCAKIVNP